MARKLPRLPVGDGKNDDRWALYRGAPKRDIYSLLLAAVQQLRGLTREEAVIAVHEMVERVRGERLDRERAYHMKRERDHE